MADKKIDPKVREFFSTIGKKSGNKIKQEIAEGKKPADYFSRISKMRKTHGRQKLEQGDPINNPVDK